VLPRLNARAAAWLCCAALIGLGAWHAALRPLAPLQRLELAVDDLRQLALLRSGPPHPHIVIVDLDDASLQRVGHWPWPRARLAQMVQELTQRQRVAALAFDIVFPEADQGAWPALQSWLDQHPDQARDLAALQTAMDQDLPLAQALRGQPAVLGYYLTADPQGQHVGPRPPALAPAPPGLRLPAWTGHVNNVAPLAEAAPQAGFFNVLPDTDGVVRSVPAVAALDGQLLPSMTLALLQQLNPGMTITPALSAPRAGAPSQDLRGLRVQTAAAEPRLITLDEQGAWRVPYRGNGQRHAGGFTYLSAHTLLDRSLPADTLRDKIVLIGSSAAGLADLRPTPIHPALPGVEIHAQLLAGLLDGRLPQRPSWAPGFEASQIAVALVLTTAVAMYLSAPAALIGMVLLLAALVAGNLGGLALADEVLPLGATLALALLLFVLLLGGRYLQSWSSRRMLMALFNQYLPPDRARQVAHHPSPQLLEADNRELTVLFCDLQGFSGIAEKLAPQALRELLNLYFTAVTQIIHAHGGTLDKFIGDAVMAFWGAPQAQPDHALHAVRAALALSDALIPLNAALQAQGLPAVRYGIGMATGVVCVGDLGSRLRRSYTAVGDAVNVAARLEALTRKTGVSLLLADSTRTACGDHTPDLAWLEVDQTTVRGREQSVTLFTPVPTTNTSHPLIVGQLRHWSLALAAARQHHTAQARAQLAQLHALNNIHTPPSLITLAEGLARQLDDDESAPP
jgi:adenylate cyclase